MFSFFRSFPLEREEVQTLRCAISNPHSSSRWNLAEPLSGKTRKRKTSSTFSSSLSTSPFVLTTLRTRLRFRALSTTTQGANHIHCKIFFSRCVLFFLTFTDPLAFCETVPVDWKVLVWIVFLSCSCGAWRLFPSSGLPTASRL